MEARGGVGQVLARLQKVLSLDDPPGSPAPTAGGSAWEEDTLAMKATVLALAREVMCLIHAPVARQNFTTTNYHWADAGEIRRS